MSFVTQQDVFDTIQPVLAGIFEEFGGGRKVDKIGHRFPYRDSAFRYGGQTRPAQPDQNAGCERSIPRSGFAIFAKLLEQDGTEIRAIPAPGGGSRKFPPDERFAQKEGFPVWDISLARR